MKRMKEKPVIALITDFGSDDPFVGIMKGVIFQIASKKSAMNISHKFSQISFTLPRKVSGFYIFLLRHNQ